jgi:hypothetical protein
MRRLSVVASLTLAASLFFLGACGSDSTGPEMPAVDGAWSLSLTNMSGSGISCSWSGITMTLTQSGTTFSGSYSGGAYTCTGGGESVSGNVGSGSVINGSIHGDNVTFQLDSPDTPLGGTISGASMSGTATMRYDLGSPYGVITLSGNWGAAKK